jgi:hypothetical protein
VDSAQGNAASHEVLFTFEIVVVARDVVLQENAEVLVEP